MSSESYELEIPDGHLIIEPIHDPFQQRGVEIPHQKREAHVQCGWVVETGKLNEHIEKDDLVVFVGWKQRNVPQYQYQHWRSDHYLLHEKDIEVVVADWDDE